MQETEKYWHYNLSKYVFRVQDLNFDWVPTWYGILGLLIFFGGGFTALRVLMSKYRAQGKSTGVLSAVEGLLTFALVVFLALFGLKRFNVEWGLLWYSTMYVLAYAAFYLASLYWIRHRRIMLTQPMLDSLIMYIFIGMLLGARTAYVFIYNWSAYKDNLWDAFKVWHGGLSFHGGIAGVIIAVTLYCKQNKVAFWNITDKMALITPFGIGMGRIGNFLNGGELYGRIIGPDAKVPWAVIFPQGGPLPRHPSQIYQSFCEGWLLLLTLFLISRKKTREGTISAAFIFFYGLYRFPMEFFREADEQLKYYFNNTLTMGQILSIVVMLVGVGVYALTRNNLVENSERWNQRMDNFFASHEEQPADSNQTKPSQS